jgi:hypothetical protein
MADQYTGNFVGPIAATLMQDIGLAALIRFAPTVFAGPLIVSAIGTGCEIKGAADIGKVAEAYKQKYCKCPEPRERRQPQESQQLDTP